MTNCPSCSGSHPSAGSCKEKISIDYSVLIQRRSRCNYYYLFIYFFLHSFYSDVFHGYFWPVPYVFGRHTFQTRQEKRKIAAVAVPFTQVLGIFGRSDKKCY